jgi:hypothetical protein
MGFNSGFKGLKSYGMTPCRIVKLPACGRNCCLHHGGWTFQEILDPGEDSTRSYLHSQRGHWVDVSGQISTAVASLLGE